MAERSSKFDIIGLVSIGPSGSHPANVVHIARAQIRVLGCLPEIAEITFCNSFARTYEGFGSERAVIASLFNFKTEDTRKKDSFRYTTEVGLKYSFKLVGNASDMHQNTIKLNPGKNNRQLEEVGQSKGGAIIRIVEVDGFPSDLLANLHTLKIEAGDVKGGIAFKACEIAQHDRVGSGQKPTGPAVYRKGYDFKTHDPGINRSPELDKKYHLHP